MKRTFIAVKSTLLANNRKVFSDLKLKLKESVINWVDSENMHLTLFFLGDTSDNQITEICKKLKEVLKDTKSFTFSLKGLGVFKNIHDPKVVWLGVENADKLRGIKKIIDKELVKFDFQVEDREFRPHLTLGRIKNLKQKTELNDFIEKYEDYQFQEIRVDEITFYESVLTPRGPIYKEIEKFRLN